MSTLGEDMKEVLGNDSEALAHELSCVAASAGRMARALRDLFNDVGAIPEVRAAFNRVYNDVKQYEGEK